MSAQSRYEPCEECGAALDPQQRYCVHCAARRGNGANPASKYFAAMSKRARRPPTRLPAKPGTGSRAAAVVFFALLPIAVALGVVVGRSGSSDSEALLQALRDQGGAVASTAGGPSSSLAAGGRAKGGKKQRSNAGEGRVIAKTDYGTVHQITNFKPSEEKTAEDTELVQNNVDQVGKDYIRAQTNLPDVIVVGGDPNSAPALPTAGNQP